MWGGPPGPRRKPSSALRSMLYIVAFHPARRVRILKDSPQLIGHLLWSADFPGPTLYR